MPIARYLNRFMKLPMHGPPMTSSTLRYRTNSSLPNTNHPTPKTHIHVQLIAQNFDFLVQSIGGGGDGGAICGIGGRGEIDAR